MFTMRPISLFLALSLFAPLTAQDGTKLRWQFKAGDVLRYRTTLEQSIEMSMMADRTMNNTVALVMREDVKEIAADGTASIDVRYEAVRMEMDMGTGTPTRFDSTLTGEGAKANDDSLAKMMKPILEAKLHINVEPSGRVSAVSGAKEMLAKATEGSGQDAASQMIERMFSEDSVHKSCEVNVFPDKALSAGDTWKRNFDQAAPPIGTMKFAVDNKYEGQEDRGGSSCAKISMATKVTLGSEDTAALPMSITMDESLGNGTLWFDNKSGRIVEMAQSVDMTMSLGPKSQDGAESAATMEINTSVSTKMLLLAKDAPAFEPANAKPAGAKK